MKLSTLKRNWMLHYIKPEYLYLPRTKGEEPGPEADFYMLKINILWTEEVANEYELYEYFTGARYTYFNFCLKEKNKMVFFQSYLKEKKIVTINNIEKEYRFIYFEPISYTNEQISQNIEPVINNLAINNRDTIEIRPNTMHEFIFCFDNKYDIEWYDKSMGYMQPHKNKIILPELKKSYRMNEYLNIYYPSYIDVCSEGIIEKTFHPILQNVAIPSQDRFQERGTGLIQSFKEYVDSLKGVSIYNAANNTGTRAIISGNRCYESASVIARQFTTKNNIGKKSVPLTTDIKLELGNIKNPSGFGTDYKIYDNEEITHRYWLGWQAEGGYTGWREHLSPVTGYTGTVTEIYAETEEENVTSTQRIEAVSSKRATTQGFNGYIYINGDINNYIITDIAKYKSTLNTLFSFGDDFFTAVPASPGNFDGSFDHINDAWWFNWIPMGGSGPSGRWPEVGELVIKDGEWVPADDLYATGDEYTGTFSQTNFKGLDGVNNIEEHSLTEYKYKRITNRIYPSQSNDSGTFGKIEEGISYKAHRDPNTYTSIEGVPTMELATNQTTSILGTALAQTRIQYLEYEQFKKYIVEPQSTFSKIFQKLLQYYQNYELYHNNTLKLLNINPLQYEYINKILVFTSGQEGYHRESEFTEGKGAANYPSIVYRYYVQTERSSLKLQDFL